MTTPEELNAIFDRIVKNQQTETDMAVLRQYLSSGGQIVSHQQSKYAVNLGQGQEIHIGDRYQGADAEIIREIVRSILEELKAKQFTPFPESSSFSSQSNQQSVDELVLKVRSRIHDHIHSSHSTMRLWGVDYWVSLGELFVDVNILEELSSSRKSELDDLWQDFTTRIQNSSSYSSLDRIGLGKKRQRISGLEVLAKNTNLMVVGKPGSGKTTYLQRVVTECNAGNLQAHRIPALIKLREFVEDGREFAYSLERYFEQHWQLSNTEIKLIFHQGRALVLLDGLDEVTGEDGKNIAKQIKQFVRNYPQVQVIVTCRTQSQESRFERFDYVEIEEFNQLQVRSFAEHWFKAVMKDESAGLKRSNEFLNQLFLETNQPIRDLAITPILLSLTCAVFHQTNKFYSKRSKLYEEGLELLLEQWDKSREIERDEIYRDLSPEKYLELLSYLAVKKFEQPQYVLFEQAEIEGYIAEFLGIGLRDSRAVLKAIESEHGLLIERAQKVWSFSHLTFQEYLVAKWFCVYNDWQRLSQNVFESHYREVFLLATEISHNHIQLMKFMKQEIDYKLGDDIYIQNFLSRVHEKSKSVVVPCHPTKIRAFYFEINRNNILNFQEKSRTSINRKFDIDINSLLNSEYTLDCILDYKLALLLYNAYCIASNPPYLDVFSYFHSNQEFIKVYEIIISYSLEDNFRRGLENIKLLLPEFSWQNSKKFTDWALQEGKIWADELRELIVKYRNIRHDLHWLPENHWRLLDQYYNATKLLLECLSSICEVSDELKNQIEDTLLLPIAEIEKRKRETAK